MDVEYFLDVIDRTRLGPKSVELAGLQLIDGLTGSEAARRVGVHECTARQAKYAVLRAWRRLQREENKDWVMVSVLLPPDKAREVRRMAKKLHRAQETQPTKNVWQPRI